MIKSLLTDQFIPPPPVHVNGSQIIPMPAVPPYALRTARGKCGHFARDHRTRNGIATRRGIQFGGMRNFDGEARGGEDRGGGGDGSGGGCWRELLLIG